MGRPKGSKNKKGAPITAAKKIKTFNVRVPKIPKYWRVRKMARLINLIEREQTIDPSYYDAVKYFQLLEQLEKVYNELIKEGLDSSEGRIAHLKGMDKEGLAEVGDTLAAAGLGEEVPSGVGDGVPAFDPFRGEG